MRPFTWVAIMDDGAAEWEEEARSINNLDRDRITQLVVVRADAPENPQTHFAVSVPYDAEPVCFARVAISVHPDAEQTSDATMVVGWRRGTQQTLLFVYSDGSCMLYDRDPDED